MVGYKVKYRIAADRENARRTYVFKYGLVNRPAPFGEVGRTFEISRSLTAHKHHV